MDEQNELLRQILAELKALNEHFGVVTNMTRHTYYGADQYRGGGGPGSGGGRNGGPVGSNSVTGPVQSY